MICMLVMLFVLHLGHRAARSMASTLTSPLCTSILHYHRVTVSLINDEHDIPYLDTAETTNVNLCNC